MYSIRDKSPSDTFDHSRPLPEAHEAHAPCSSMKVRGTASEDTADRSAVSERSLGTATPRGRDDTGAGAESPARRFRLWCLHTADPDAVLVLTNRECALECADRSFSLGRIKRDILSQDGFVDCIPQEHGISSCRLVGPVACEARWDPCPELGFDGVWLVWDQTRSAQHVIGFLSDATDEDLACEFAGRLNRELSTDCSECGARDGHCECDPCEQTEDPLPEVKRFPPLFTASLQGGHNPSVQHWRARPLAS